MGDDPDEAFCFLAKDRSSTSKPSVTLEFLSLLTGVIIVLMLVICLDLLLPFVEGWIRSFPWMTLGLKAGLLVLLHMMGMCMRLSTYSSENTTKSFVHISSSTSLLLKLRLLVIVLTLPLKGVTAQFLVS